MPILPPTCALTICLTCLQVTSHFAKEILASMFFYWFTIKMYSSKLSVVLNILRYSPLQMLETQWRFQATNSI